MLEHITNIIKFTNFEEIKEFEKNVKNSENWILEDEISSNLNIFIPIGMYVNPEDTRYYWVYIVRYRRL